MSKIPNNSDGLNDADFATLFASDNSVPPKELDKLILDNALLSQHDSLPQRHETFLQRYSPLFGTAAVLMIAFGLTPLTMNVPDNSLAEAPASIMTNTSENTLTTAAKSITSDAPVTTLAQAPSAETAAVMSGQEISVELENQTSLASRIAGSTSQPVPPAQEPTLLDSIAASTAVESIATESDDAAPARDTSVGAISIAEADTDAEGFDINESSLKEKSTADLGVTAEVGNDRQTALAVPESITNAVIIKDEYAAEKDSIDSNNAMISEQISVPVPEPEPTDASAPELQPEPQAEAEAEAEVEADTDTDTDAVAVPQPVAVPNIEAVPETTAAPVETLAEPAIEVSISKRNEEVEVETIKLTESEVQKLSIGSADKSLGLLELQNDSGELLDNAPLPIVELELSTLLPNTLTADTSARLKQAPENSAESRVDNTAPRTVKPERKKAKNYRDSALLWVIEIKHLFNEKNTEQARKELILFRKKYPDNANERLLPKQLQDAELD